MSAPAVQDVAVVWVDYIGSDWLGIYVNGERVYEGHPPDLQDALAYLDVHAEAQTFPSDRLADLSRSRGLPRRLPRAAS